MRPIRLLLFVLMLACLPLQGWAGMHASGQTGAALTSDVAATAMPDKAMADKAMADDALIAADSKSDDDTRDARNAVTDPVDHPAEHLLPVRLAPAVHDVGRAGLPRYAGTALPDPDLPRLPRPPRG